MSRIFPQVVFCFRGRLNFSHYWRVSNFIEMANGKKSFVLYTDVHFTVQKLTDEQAGKLFKHILSYVNDENPVIDDLILQIAFEPIKQSLKRDLKRYEAMCLKNRINGVKGGRPKGKAKKPNGLIKNPNNPNGPDSDSDSDSDSDNDRRRKKKNKYSDFVSLTEKEYQKLIEGHGEKNTQLFIEILNNYKGSTGKRYKSDYLTILNWVIDKAKKEGKYKDSSIKLAI